MVAAAIAADISDFGMHDIAEFLRRHPPFDTLDEETLAAVAASAEIEFHAAGAPIIESAEATSEFVYVVRRGSVELRDRRPPDGRDGRRARCSASLSLLQDGPLGFVARAAEDTLVYRIPAAAITPVLERPAAARFVARSMNRRVRLLADRGARAGAVARGRRVRELIRAAPLVCEPATTVQDAARRMVDAGVTCAVVDLGDQLGIVTDRDIRDAGGGGGRRRPTRRCRR